MKEIRIEITEMNEYPLYSFFMKDKESDRDEYYYLGCIGSAMFSEYEEWEGFESLVKFLLDRLSNTFVELPCSVESYCVIYDSESWEDEWDSYGIDIDKHCFGSGDTIEVKTGDLNKWENSTLEDFVKELGIILGVKFEVIR